jgi:OOP family OmpA-OmpF porin
MKKQLISATVAACISLAGIALPASAELPITLNAGAGYWYFDRDDVRGFEPDDTTTPWAGMEWAFNDNWAAEVIYAYDDSGEFKNGGPDLEVTNWQLGMLYYGGSYIGEPMRVRPYVALSAGEIKLEADNFDTVETTINGGVGVRWMMGKRLGLRVEGRAIYSLDESETDYLVSAGLNFYMGKVDPDPIPAPLDSDGDGVTDDKDRCPGTPMGTRVDADGCPLAVAQVASIKLKVNFAFDSDVVQERYFADLGELAEFLKRFSDLQVDVEGHTDSVGPEDYNQQLSQRRAQAVVDMLVNQYGIAATRLEPKGYGESKPVASNDTEEGRAENRRVMATLEVEYEE